MVEDIYHYRGVDRFIYSTYDLWAYISDEFYYIETIEGNQRLYKCIDYTWQEVPVGQYEAEIKARRRAFLQDSAAVKQYKGEVRRLIRMAARLTRSERSFRSLIESRQELRLSA